MNEFVRYTKWVPSRQHGIRGMVECNGDLSGVKKQLDDLGILWTVKDRVGYVRGTKIHQRAIFANAGQLAERGVPLSVFTGNDREPENLAEVTTAA